MLAAIVEHQGARIDVFVRDVSTGGAMVEGRGLPAPAERIVLVRGAMRLDGAVVWRVANRAGLRFDGQILVADMMRRVGFVPAHQARVDEIQRALRSGAAESKALPSFTERRQAPRDLSADFGYAVRIVEAVGDALTADAYVLSRHGTTLQRLDELAQLIRRIEGHVAEAARDRA